MDYSKIVAEAQARRDELQLEMHALDDLIASASQLAKLDNRGLTVSVKARVVPAISPTRKFTAQILRERGGPTKSADLLPLLRDRGVEVGGKTPWRHYLRGCRIHLNSRAIGSMDGGSRTNRYPTSILFSRGRRANPHKNNPPPRNN